MFYYWSIKYPYFFDDGLSIIKIINMLVDYFITYAKDTL